MKVTHQDETLPGAREPLTNTPLNPQVTLPPQKIPPGEDFSPHEMPLPEQQHEEETRPPWTPDPGE